MAVAGYIIKSTQRSTTTAASVARHRECEVHRIHTGTAIGRHRECARRGWRGDIGRRETAHTRDEVGSLNDHSGGRRGEGDLSAINATAGWIGQLRHDRQHARLARAHRLIVVEKLQQSAARRRRHTERAQLQIRRRNRNLREALVLDVKLVKEIRIGHRVGGPHQPRRNFIGKLEACKRRLRETAGEQRVQRARSHVRRRAQFDVVQRATSAHRVQQIVARRVGPLGIEAIQRVSKTGERRRQLCSQIDLDERCAALNRPQVDAHQKFSIWRDEWLSGIRLHLDFAVRRHFHGDRINFEHAVVVGQVEVAGWRQSQPGSRTGAVPVQRERRSDHGWKGGGQIDGRHHGSRRSDHALAQNISPLGIDAHCDVSRLTRDWQSGWR